MHNRLNQPTQTQSQSMFLGSEPFGEDITFLLGRFDVLQSHDVLTKLAHKTQAYPMVFRDEAQCIQL